MSVNARSLTTMPRCARELKAELLDRFGVIVGGVDLRRALGFRSAATFQRALREKTLKIRLFDVPGRRGKFALTADVAAWLAEVICAIPKPTERQAPTVQRTVGEKSLAKASKETKM